MALDSRVHNLSTVRLSPYSPYKILSLLIRQVQEGSIHRGLAIVCSGKLAPLLSLSLSLIHQSAILVPSDSRLYRIATSHPEAVLTNSPDSHIQGTL